MESLTIGRAARLAGAGVETIRFYEREGLLEKPPHRESGYRQYPKEIISRLRFIKRAKKLGFTLKEIKELLALRNEPETACEDRIKPLLRRGPLQYNAALWRSSSSELHTVGKGASRIPTGYRNDSRLERPLLVFRRLRLAEVPHSTESSIWDSDVCA